MVCDLDADLSEPQNTIDNVEDSDDGGVLIEIDLFNRASEALLEQCFFP